MDSTTDDGQASRVTAPAFGAAFPVPTAAAATDPAPVPAFVRGPARAPELIGADELAAPPAPFPPPPVAATPLVAPPEPPVAAPPVAGPPVTESPVAASQINSAPTPERPDVFASLLTPTSTPTVGETSSSTDSDESGIARSTVVERIVLVLAVILPPIGVIAGIVAAIRSARRRGWVVGILRAAIAIGVVLSVVAAIGGSLAYRQLRAQQLHDQTVAASAAFCRTIAAHPAMISTPDFGWPAVAGSIPDTIAAMQSYTDAWTKLAAVSPPGVSADVMRVATAAKQITDSVTQSRTVDDASNIATMTSIASVSGVPAWHREYCT